MASLICGATYANFHVIYDVEGIHKEIVVFV